MEHKNPWELPIEPTIAPVTDHEERKPSIIEIEGVLEIIRRQENGEDEEGIFENPRKQPTIH